jgi:hypothetical protein
MFWGVVKLPPSQGLTVSCPAAPAVLAWVGSSAGCVNHSVFLCNALGHVGTVLCAQVTHHVLLVVERLGQRCSWLALHSMQHCSTVLAASGL